MLLCFEIEPKGNYVVKAICGKLCKILIFKVIRFSHLWRVKLANFVTLYIDEREQEQEGEKQTITNGMKFINLHSIRSATLVNQPKWLHMNLWKWWCKILLCVWFFFGFVQCLYAIRVRPVKLVEQAVTRRRRYIQQLLRAKNSKLKVRHNAQIETIPNYEKEKKQKRKRKKSFSHLQLRICAKWPN